MILLDLAGVSMFAVGTLGWLLRLTQGDVEPAVATLAILVAAFATDFVSGLFHFACDRFGEPDWPVVGKAFIAPFREHHVDPDAITRHGFLEVNGATCFAALPTVAAAWFLAGSEVRIATFGSIFFGTLSLLVLATNQVHKWAHAPRVGRVVGRLQAWGLALSPHRHDGHHRAPFASDYCITFGWLNPWLDRWRVWSRLEHRLRRVCRPSSAAPGSRATASMRVAVDVGSCPPAPSTDPARR